MKKALTTLFIVGVLGALLVPVQTGCGLVVMCPSNDAYKRQLDGKFFSKASHCASGDDKACDGLDNEAKDKEKSCHNCNNCDGKEKYVEVAATAKLKNGCDHHADGTACYQLGAKEDEEASAKNKFSPEAIMHFQKACELGKVLDSCKRSKLLSEDQSKAVEHAKGVASCQAACASSMPAGCPSCLTVEHIPPTCAEACHNLQVCLSTCR